MAKQTDDRVLQELLSATKRQTLAEERAAGELAAKNKIDAAKLEEERLRTTQLNDVLQAIQRCSPTFHEPMMVLLLELKQNTATLLELSKVIAMRVLGEKDTRRLIETVTKAAQHSDVVRVDFGDVSGDLSVGDVAGGTLRKS